MKSLISFIIVAEIAASVFLFGYDPKVSLTTPKHIVKVDQRVAKLTAFMDKYHFSKPYYINEYITEADKNNINFAVLPAIAVLESGGCRHYRYSNCWGWNSAASGFRSIPEGIAFVSQQLATGRPYAGKSLKAKIQTYNPPSVNPAYYSNFIKLYNELQ